MERRLVLSKRRSGDIARRRLKFLLTADKTGFPPETLEMLKSDICRVISRYMDVDPGQIEMRVGLNSPMGDGGFLPALYTVIPIKSPNIKGTF